MTRHRRPMDLVAQLVREGLWEPQEDGWAIHDYLDWHLDLARERCGLFLEESA